MSLLTVHAATLAWSAYRQAPTYDEVAYLPAGLSHWYLGRFDLAAVSPPLVRLVAAVPLLAASPNFDWQSYNSSPTSRSEHRVGQDFIDVNGPRTFWLFTLGRWACIPFSIIGACVCYLWARDLYGNASGLLALVLWCFGPNILAHGQLVTPDMGTTALGVAAAYCFWRWLKNPDWKHAMLAGAMLGLAELCKSTLLVFFALWPLLWLVSFLSRSSQRSGHWRWKQLSQLLLIVGLAVYVMNLGYLFENSFRPLREFQFVSQVLGGEGVERFGVGNRFADTWLGEIPVPLPANYVLGLDFQKMQLENDNGQMMSYLNREWRNHGWWYYYVYAMAVKVPLGTWVLAIVALYAFCRWPGARAGLIDELALMLPFCVLLFLVSSQTGFNHHMRYALPAFPFGIIWISRVGRAFELKRGKSMAFVALAATWSVTSSLFVAPHSLSYFNELVGGPHGGHAHLIDSNIDWGQDLLYLKRWLDAHPEARPMHVAYFGRAPLEVAGIQSISPPPGGPNEPGTTDFPVRTDDSPAGRAAMGPQPGWHAVSVNYLRGVTWTTGGDYRYFNQLYPIGSAGYSIRIYYVSPKEANTVRNELRLPPIDSTK